MVLSSMISDTFSTAAGRWRCCLHSWAMVTNVAAWWLPAICLFPNRSRFLNIRWLSQLLLIVWYITVRFSSSTLKVSRCKWPRKIRAENLMARQRALSEWILSNGNLWTGPRSLIVGHCGKPFFRQIKDRRKNMEKTVYNPHKGRLETINNCRWSAAFWFTNAAMNIRFESMTARGSLLVMSGTRHWNCIMTDRCGITPVPAMGGVKIGLSLGIKFRLSFHPGAADNRWPLK